MYERGSSSENSSCALRFPFVLFLGLVAGSEEVGGMEEVDAVLEAVRGVDEVDAVLEEVEGSEGGETMGGGWSEELLAWPGVFACCERCLLYRLLALTINICRRC